jgi:hypothetical protein
LLRIDAVIVGFAAVDGLHREGMAEDAGDTFARTPISHPIPRAHTFDCPHQSITLRRNALEEGLGTGLDVLMHQDLPSVVEDANRHRPGGEIDPTVCLLLLGGESHEVSSSSEAC